MTRLALVALVLALTFAAGCSAPASVDHDATPADHPAARQGPPAAGPAQNGGLSSSTAPSNAPSSSGAGSGGASAGAKGTAASAAPSRAIPFAADGHLALGVCYDSPAGTACFANVGDPTKGGSATRIGLPIEGSQGTVRSGHADITWQASTPLTNTLTVRLVTMTGCPEACHTESVWGETTSTSPLGIDVPAGREVPGGQSLAVVVARSDAGQGVSGSGFQDVHIEGQLLMTA